MWSHRSAVPGVPTLAKDLRAAGIEPGTPEAGIVDLHALRATFCTSLARADVSLVLAQRLMRHADPKLTANTYSKLELHDSRAAVAKIDRPAPAASPPSGATGRLGGKLGVSPVISTDEKGRS